MCILLFLHKHQDKWFHIFVKFIGQLDTSLLFCIALSFLKLWMKTLEKGCDATSEIYIRWEKTKLKEILSQYLQLHVRTDILAGGNPLNI